jgi:hypothetical protein
MNKIVSTNRWIFRSSLAPLLRISLCIVAGLLLISCASLPKETYLTSKCLTGIKKVAIVASLSSPEVKKAKNYDVNPLPFGILGSLSSLYKLIIDIQDMAETGEIKEHMNFSSIESKMAQSFIQKVKKGDCFQVVEYVNDKNQDNSNLSATGYDAVIRLAVHDILFRNIAGDYIGLTANVQGQLEILRSGEIVWDRVEMVTNPEPHPLDYYKENGLIELDAMLEKAGRNLAYDFLYSK